MQLFILTRALNKSQLSSQTNVGRASVKEATDVVTDVRESIPRPFISVVTTIRTRQFMQLGGIFDIIIVNYLPFQTADLLNAECTPTTFVEPLGNVHIQTATLDASWTLNSGFIIFNTHI